MNKDMVNLPKNIVISAAILASALLLSSSALAASPNSQANARKEAAQRRLQDGKLKACQVRESGIKKRSDQLTKLATNMEQKFDSITQRVEDYYKTLVVPSGKTVSNYSVLVSDIATKKAAVQTALTKAQKDLTSFSCDGTDPKGQMMIFREDMQSAKKALKDYRTSIKNLIVAVHSITGTENKESTSSANASHSPRPSHLPNQGGNKP